MIERMDTTCLYCLAIISGNAPDQFFCENTNCRENYKEEWEAKKTRKKKTGFEEAM